MDGEQCTYLATDSLKEVNAAGIILLNSALDYIAKQTPPGLPSHTLTIKVNGIYCLIWNLSINHSLLKNVCIIVTEVSNWLVTVQLIKIHNGILHTKEDILIPYISCTYVLPSGHILLCQQFPLAPGYATMLNSCQGLNLNTVGLDVTVPVFSHGQLYTALSRIRNCT